MSELTVGKIEQLTNTPKKFIVPKQAILVGENVMNPAYVSHLEAENARLTARVAELEERLRWRNYPEEKPNLGQLCVCEMIGTERIQVWVFSEPMEENIWEWVGRWYPVSLPIPEHVQEPTTPTEEK